MRKQHSPLLPRSQALPGTALLARLPPRTLHSESMEQMATNQKPSNQIRVEFCALELRTSAQNANALTAVPYGNNHSLGETNFITPIHKSRRAAANRVAATCSATTTYTTTIASRPLSFVLLNAVFVFRLKTLTRKHLCLKGVRTDACRILFADEDKTRAHRRESA